MRRRDEGKGWGEGVKERDEQGRDPTPCLDPFPLSRPVVSSPRPVPSPLPLDCLSFIQSPCPIPSSLPSLYPSPNLFLSSIPLVYFPRLIISLRPLIPSLTSSPHIIHHAIPSSHHSSFLLIHFPNPLPHPFSPSLPRIPSPHPKGKR